MNIQCRDCTKVRYCKTRKKIEQGRLPKITRCAKELFAKQ